MHVTLIDGSHRDRPRLDITATEVISNKGGTIILEPYLHENYLHIKADPAVPTSIVNLARDCAKGPDDIRLSHDWIVKVRD